jgi:hypothetical protein
MLWKVFVKSFNNSKYKNNPGSFFKGDIMMIEADISLGTLASSPSEVIPIMAHPPSTVSDLSLEMFLSEIVNVSE